MEALALFLLSAVLRPQSVEQAQPPVQAVAEVSAEELEDILTRWLEAESSPPGQLTEVLAGMGSGAEGLLRARLERKQGLGRALEPLTMALVRIGRSPESLQALRALSRSELRDERVIGARALGACGRREVLPDLLEALEDDQRRVRSTARRSIVELANGDPGLPLAAQIAPRIEGSEHLDDLALALGGVGGREAKALLHDMLGRWTNERMVLAGMAGLWLCLDDGDGVILHELISSSNPTAVRKKACVLLGKLGWSAAVRDLLDCMHASDKGLAKDAHWALKRITGLGLRADLELWEAWWERSGRATYSASELHLGS